MKITRGYKTELDPTVKQHILLCQCAGTARFAYNDGLARKQEVSKESGKFVSAIDLQKEVTARKHTDLRWLKGVSKWIVQNALRDLDQAYDNFFRRVRERKAGKKHQSLGFPKFKSKSQGRGSFRLDTPIQVFDDRIQLPKLGTLRLKERNYLPTSGVKVLSATVSERAGKWFVRQRPVSTPAQIWLMHLFGEAPSNFVRTCYTFSITLEEESPTNANHPLTSVARWA
jgi:transposase